jgi:hypothetical protein
MTLFPRLIGALCGLVLAPLVSASAASPEKGMGYTYCFDPHPPEPYGGVMIACDKLPPEELARQRAYTDDVNRRYDEQQKVLIPPTTKPDLTLVCNGFSTDYNATVQIWFGANVMTWGIGPNSEVWRLTKVSPSEIAFTHIILLEDGPYDLARGQINRVTGAYDRDIPRGGMGDTPMGTNRGDCKPAAPKF